MLHRSYYKQLCGSFIFILYLDKLRNILLIMASISIFGSMLFVCNLNMLQVGVCGVGVALCVAVTAYSEHA